MAEQSESERATSEELARIVGFTDGVFAIAITLLVLNIEIPNGSVATTVATETVVGEWPDVLSYVISFLVVGNYWIGHNDVFSHIERYDRRLLWLNVLYLMFVAFLPYATALLGDHGGRFAVVVYATTVVAVSVIFALLWQYAWRSGLVEERIDAEGATDTTLDILAPATVFAVSIPVAFLSASLAMYSWLLLLAIDPVRRRVSARMAG